jgi:predicted ATP-dependent endonuclease of OLD family
MLLLAMLSQIAEDKQNVIFAMEEPETAIPPYAQKRIVHELRKLSAQSIFTSHSPYVLEEFGLNETVVLGRSSDGVQATQLLIGLRSERSLMAAGAHAFVKLGLSCGMSGCLSGHTTPSSAFR